MQQVVSTRRIFLQRGLALLAVAPTIPSFLEQTVFAMDNPLDAKRVQGPNGKDGKILVVVQLSGGNDGLSMVVPYGDDAYNRARRDIRIEANSVLKLDSYAGLHPNLTALKELYDKGHMAVIHGVGYPNPNRSHFRSMDIWHTAAPERENVTAGWLGRYFDNTCVGIDPHAGVSIGETLPLAMRGDRVTPLSFERTEAYRYKGRDPERYIELNHSDASPVAAEKKTGKPAPITAQAQLDFLRRTAMDAQLSSDDILRMTRSYRTTANYPNNEFGNGLRTIAAMIAGGLATRVYYVSLGGFDTHASQRGRHDNLMKELSDGVGAFWNDLKEQHNDGRVLMMTFSEFGRRVQQNASGGTDHGAAAPMFVLGSNIKSGIVGRYPSLTDLDQGDLKFGTDFRCVYAGILQNWLETPSKPILGQQFKALPIVKA